MSGVSFAPRCSVGPTCVESSRGGKGEAHCALLGLNTRLALPEWHADADKTNAAGL